MNPTNLIHNHQRQCLLEFVAYLQERSVQDVQDEYLGRGAGLISNRLYSGVETTVARLNKPVDSAEAMEKRI